MLKKVNKKRIFGYLLTLVILGAFLVYFLYNREDFMPLLGVPILSIAILCVLKVLIWAARGFFYIFVFKVYDKKMTFFDGFFATFISTFANFFLPFQGGAGVRAILFKKKYGLSYTRYLSVLSGIYVFSFLVNSLLGLIALVYIHVTDGVYSVVLYVFFALVFVGTVFMSLINFRNSGHDKAEGGAEEEKKRDESVIQVVRRKFFEIIEGWSQLTSNRKLFLQIAGIFLIDLVLNLISFHIIFQSLDISLGLEQLVIYTTLSGLSILISFTPSGIGIREAVIVIFSEYLGITGDQVLMASVLDRGTLFLMLILGFVFFRVFMPDMFVWSQKKEEKEDDGEQ